MPSLCCTRSARHRPSRKKRPWKTLSREVCIVSTCVCIFPFINTHAHKYETYKLFLSLFTSATHPLSPSPLPPFLSLSLLSLSPSLPLSLSLPPPPPPPLPHAAKPVVEHIQDLRLSADDFDTLEVIGRGAFGEVKVQSSHDNIIIQWVPLNNNICTYCTSAFYDILDILLSR